MRDALQKDLRRKENALQERKRSFVLIIQLIKNEE